MQEYKSVSIYTMWMYISRFLFLLIIPALQQIILKPAGLYEIFITMWPSILMICIIILISFFEYKSIKYAKHNNILLIKKGIIFKRKLIVPIKNINAVVWQNTIILSLFKSKKISLCAKTGNNRTKNIVSLFLKRNELNNIFNLKDEKCTIRTGPLKILLMSASWSNPIVSLLIAVPFINKAAGIVGEEVTQKLYYTMDSLLKFLKLGLPPLIASISYLILGAFFVTIVIHFFRYANFKTELTDEHIVVTSGLISENKKIIDKNKINVIIIKQSLFMIILKLYNAYVHVMGMPGGKGEYNLLLAALKKNELKNAIYNIYKIKSERSDAVRPERKRLKNFLFLPIGAFLFLILAIVGFIGEKWYERIIMLTSFFILFLIIWWMIIRYFAYKHSKVLVNTQLIYISGFKAMSLYSALIPLNKVQSITIKRNPLSKWSNICKVQINIYAGNKDKFVCKYLDYTEIKKLFKNTNKYLDSKLIL